MLWYCRFTWLPGTTMERVRQRVLQQHAAGTNHPEMIKGWYNLAGGGAGFMLIDTLNARDLNEILEPYMDLVSWDVHAVYELPYREVVEHFREAVHAAGSLEAADDTKGIIRRFADEVWNQGRLDRIPDYVEPSFYGVDPAFPSGLRGHEDYRTYCKTYRDAFPDLHLTIDELFCEADRIAVRWTVTGTHTGELRGSIGTFAATGKPVRVSGTIVARLSANNKIIESWQSTDRMSLIEQLGIAAPMAAAGRPAGS